MNVNPFSYLMNKISQKVSKSGDTMTGELEINNVTNAIHINRTGSTAYSGWLRFSNANGFKGQIGVNNGGQLYYYTPETGNYTPVALTSDITKLVEFQTLDNVGSATFQVPKVNRGVFMIVNRLGILVISENTSGDIEQLTALGNITYTDNGSNSITVPNGAYYRGVSLIQLC